MQPNRIRNLRSQIAANRYRKSKDEHTATEAYNCLTPDANTRHTKVSDYLHAPLPKVSKKSCRALLASGRNLTIGKRQGLLQLFDSDIAETHFRTVTEESDMAFLVLKARMIAVVERAILARLGDIALGDDRTVERHADVVALDPYLLGIPFADRLQETALGRDHAVNRPVILVLLELAVNRSLVIEHLNLHTHIGRVAFERGTDTDSVVGPLGQLELEPQHEVAELLLRIEVSAAAVARIERDRSVLGHVVARVSDPAVHVRTVVQQPEALFPAPRPTASSVRSAEVR